jgi:hypothetical protein
VTLAEAEISDNVVIICEADDELESDVFRAFLYASAAFVTVMKRLARSRVTWRPRLYSIFKTAVSATDNSKRLQGF